MTDQKVESTEVVATPVEVKAVVEAQAETVDAPKEEA